MLGNSFHSSISIQTNRRPHDRCPSSPASTPESGNSLPLIAHLNGPTVTNQTFCCGRYKFSSEVMPPRKRIYHCDTCAVLWTRMPARPGQG